MFELLFMIGVVAWMLELLCEYLSDLAVFPTLLTAVLAIPFLAYFDYNFTLQRQFLGNIGEDRAPIPPETFRWSLVRPRWRRQILWASAILPFGWLPIFWFPAEGNASTASLIGWVCGALAIGSSTLVLSRLCLYFRVGQWFDAMTPRLAGWFWKMLYRVSDNYEYLPPEKQPERDREKAIF